MLISSPVARDENTIVDKKLLEDIVLNLQIFLISYTFSLILCEQQSTELYREDALGWPDRSPSRGRKGSSSSSKRAARSAPGPDTSPTASYFHPADPRGHYDYGYGYNPLHQQQYYQHHYQYQQYCEQDACFEKKRVTLRHKQYEGDEEGRKGDAALTLLKQSDTASRELVASFGYLDGAPSISMDIFTQ
ncbi:hypothetical protein FOCC_FOCC002152 [Frankliniella occidentalis]|nr:hypothetical protein FOCC_FOCC002152 [Frankliniella occidentalis]